MKLTNRQCETAKPKLKDGVLTDNKLFDGGGLFLLVKKDSGTKLWRLKYYYLGKEKLMSLGAYPQVTLAEAREKREEAKKLLGMSPPQDPIMKREENNRLALHDNANTFEAVALEWHETKKNQWSEDYAHKVMRCLTMNVFPYIGQRPIAQITPPELLDCLRKVEKRGALDILGRTKQLCGMVFRYGVATGKCERDASADLRGALKVHKKEHFRTIEAKQIPVFINALERNEARLYERTRRAVWLSMLTFVRPVELRKAQWSEINFEEQVWSIAANKMKSRRDHIVPLSKQAIEVLKEQREETGHLNTDWVFPSQVRPKQPMSDGTVNMAIKRLGFGKELVAHGFRALARTVIREKLGLDSEIIERQLAHKASGPLGESYDRTKFIEQRIPMMQVWADYLVAVSSQGKVITGNFKKAS
jgi:integrase